MLYCNAHNKSNFNSSIKLHSDDCIPTIKSLLVAISYLEFTLMLKMIVSSNGVELQEKKGHDVNYKIHWICMLLAEVLNPCQMHVWQLHEAPNHQFATIWARLNCPNHLGHTICCCHFSVKICPKQSCLQCERIFQISYFKILNIVKFD